MSEHQPTSWNPHEASNPAEDYDSAAGAPPESQRETEDHKDSDSTYEESAPRGAAQADPKAKDTRKVAWAGFKIGDTVPALGVKIGEILLNTRKAFVFLDTEGNVEWLYYQDPPDSAWAHARVVELESRCAFFKQSGDSRSFMENKPVQMLHFDYRNHERSAKRFIAQGIVILHSGGTKAEAETAFASAERFIIQRGREVSLIWLYSTFGVLAAISAVTLFGLALWFPQTDLFFSVLTCAAAGGVGAYISRALASREDLPCDANAGKRLHMEEALLRWSVGVVAGGLVCLLVRGKILLGPLASDNSGFPAVLALALLAGVSERFLPTLLDRFNNKLASTEGKQFPPPQ